MKPPRLIVLSMEGLSTAALGAYGCSWNQTPQLDRLAAGGSLFDRCIVPGDQTADVLRGLWQAIPKGMGLQVISDDQATIQVAGQCDCAAVRFIDSNAEELPAEDVADTILAQLLAEAAPLVSSKSSSGDAGITWIHSNFLVRAWDAPRSLLPAESLQDDDLQELANAVNDDLRADHPPSYFDTVQPPRWICSTADDPDLVLAWMNTYAAQVRLLDVMVGILQELVDGETSRLVILGTSGFALGEAGYIGGDAGPLTSPRIQVPCLACGAGIPNVRYIDPCSVITAWQTLVSAQPACQSLLAPEAWAVPIAPEQPPIVTKGSDGTLGITTPTWFYWRHQNQEQLFVKPDDRGDTHNVVDRAGEEVLRQFRSGWQSKDT